MHHYFKDIVEKLGEPKWYDIHGFPRYCDFSPDETYNIYADVVVLLEIRCQSCHKKFLVAESIGMLHLYDLPLFKVYLKENNVSNKESLTNHIAPFFKSLTDEQLNDYLHYGDPPRHFKEYHDGRGGCVGDTMNVMDDRIVEFWVRGGMSKEEWKRISELEKTLPDGL